MKLKDIEPGGVYAYWEGQDWRYRSTSPVLVLSTDKYMIPHRGGGKIQPALPKDPMRRGHWNVSEVGLPAVILFDEASAKNAVASVKDFTYHGDVRENTNGKVVGRYFLITSLGFLRGEFEAVKADEAIRDEKTAKLIARREAEAEEVTTAYKALAARFRDLGFDSPDYNPRRFPPEISLTFEQAGKILALIEGARERKAE